MGSSYLKHLEMMEEPSWTIIQLTFLETGPRHEVYLEFWILDTLLQPSSPSLATNVPDECASKFWNLHFK